MGPPPHLCGGGILKASTSAMPVACTDCVNGTNRSGGQKKKVIPLKGCLFMSWIFGFFGGRGGGEGRGGEENS